MPGIDHPHPHREHKYRRRQRTAQKFDHAAQQTVRPDAIVHHTHFLIHMDDHHVRDGKRLGDIQLALPAGIDPFHKNRS